MLNGLKFSYFAVNVALFERLGFEKALMNSVWTVTIIKDYLQTGQINLPWKFPYCTTQFIQDFNLKILYSLCGIYSVTAVLSKRIKPGHFANRFL